MEPKRPEQIFTATDITFHGRDLKPTEKFENAQKTAKRKGSEIVRVYGIPRLVVDLETKLVYLDFQFSSDITEKLRNGTLVIPKDVPSQIDEPTQKLMKEKEKRRLKNSTRVWRSPK